MHKDMTIFQALFGEVKPNEEKKITRDSFRQEHQHLRNSYAKKKIKDEKESSDLSFNFYGQHNVEAQLSNSGSAGFAARKLKSGKGRRISRSPGRPIQSHESSFCCLFGPYVAVLILVMLVQAASFLFLHHQVDVMRHNYYQQYKVIHQHMASLMSEFRNLKTDIEYSKSIENLSNLYNRNKQDVITDDEEYDPQFSGHSNDDSSKISFEENARGDLTLKKKYWDKFANFDYYLDIDDEHSGDDEMFDNLALLHGVKNMHDAHKNSPVSNTKINETLENTSLRSSQELAIMNTSINLDITRSNDEEIQQLSRLPRSTRNKQQAFRRRFRSSSARSSNDQYYFPSPLGLSSMGHSLSHDDRNTMRKRSRRRGRGASRKESTVYPAVEASYAPSLSREDTSASYRGHRLNRLLSARGRKTSYNSPVIDAPQAPSHNRVYGEAFGYRSYDSVADNSYRSGLQPGSYRTSTHKRDHERASRVLVDDRNKRLQNDRDQNLLLQTTAARHSANDKLNNYVRPLDSSRMVEYSHPQNPDRFSGSENDQADSNSEQQPNPLTDFDVGDRRHNYARSRNIRVSESQRGRASFSSISGIQNDQATKDEVIPGAQDGTTSDDEQEADVDTSWLQLTSYSKIPYDAIEEFCTRTRSSCPPGPAGPMGLEGTKGTRGDKGELGAVGPKGDRGPLGPQGLIGPPGPAGKNGRKGDMGITGMTGLDGRDGLPGEPGLDGIPGRNGLDGIPGVDGIPGFDGLPGRDGRNGTDGEKGSRGLKGGTGDEGPRGLPGPRGRTGKSGRAGTPGIPGITTWKVNGTSPRHLLIPPAIPGPRSNSSLGSLVVYEGDHVRLRCAATGVPSPKVEWRRLDDNAIPTGRWKDASVNDPVLNLTHIRRDHTGLYMCEAYNGVPPNAFKTFKLEVHFEPFIQVKEWKVGAFNGSSARMECRVESYPVALTYWENRHGQLLENSHKFRVYNVPHSNFVWRSTLVLLITNITGLDYGGYYCIAKNEHAITRGTVELHEIDPRRYKPSTGATGGVSFGPEVPNYSELFGDLCPPAPVCEECPAPPAPVHDSGFLYCLNIGQFGNDTYPGFSNRSLDCKLSAIGKPVFNRHTNNDYGSWLRDPLPRNKFYAPYYYSTRPDEPRRLFEYDSKENFRQDEASKNYSLPFPFTGNSHVVYNGSFYYHEANSSNLIRFDLISKTVRFQPLPLLTTVGANYLYTETRDHLDLSVDENGLWAIYGLSNNNTVVVKVEPISLTIEYSWNISLNHHKFGEMFVTCGVLYGIDSSTERETKIRFALDLYMNKVLDVDLKFTNPFRKTTSLGYNPRAKEIYSWDSGNQLNYPIVYIDIGYDAPDEDLGVLTVPDYDQDYEVVRQQRLTATSDDVVRNDVAVQDLQKAR
ncbi:Collagen triple helix repeat [Trinorchestia longiramus]|nr:Collagen triple helix repeat [Trinorchestia longiramus]